jgi:large subunit ribosomal protein L13
MKTVVVNQKSILHSWYVVDASNLVLGRLSSRISSILTGKLKPAYSPNQDHGDNVVVINSDKVKITGKKADMKTYFTHSGQPGKEKNRLYSKQMELDSTKVITHAVKGMLPKTNLGRSMLKKLFVYKGAEHPHAAQKPQPLPQA